jgi:hypothetical protein
VTPTKVQEGKKMTEDLETVDQENVVIPETEAEEVEPQEETLTKDIVSKIVTRERRKAFEKGKREALMELQAQQQQQSEAQQPEQMQAPQQAQSLGGIQQMSPADIERMIAEQLPRHLQEQATNMQHRQIVDSFVSKMEAAEQKYPGIQERLNDLDFASMAPLIQMANNMENTGDIMHELMENPMKMGNLLTLMYTQPKLAEREMHSLSGSIKQNESAKAQEAQAQDPMSQLRPSPNAGLDNGNLSVSDFRKMFRG